MVGEHRWWFSLVAASPNPETHEQVNVALLIGNGELLRLEYNEGLPRLRCIAGPVEIKLLGDALQGVRRSLSTFEHLTSLRQYLGPQVQISDPRPLFRAPDSKIVGKLRRKYLGDVRRRRRKTKSRQRISRIDETIREFVSQKAFGLRVEKQVGPGDLFERPRRVFETTVPKVDRALRSAHRDLLIGGISIDPRKPHQSMSGPGLRLGRAFWHYREARRRIFELTGREVRTVGLIFNGALDADHGTGEALEYAAHVWGQDADAVVQVDNPSDANKLTGQVDWVTGWDRLPPVARP